ncbi:hypothetical protein Egran_03320 [Elaphomyces granulatus]|uniref:Uncharacterized protein n=1 Tax=Elaphomyces granulatus TaxID=519963 RepID=A0A232LYM4_9EURO|nr:hypothetical protein Egran_03320 [Elaphomyces granulatus]
MDIRWIDGKNNPADAMTKSAPNGALGTRELPDYQLSPGPSGGMGAEKRNGGTKRLMPPLSPFGGCNATFTVKEATIVKMKSQLLLIVALMLGTTLATPLDGASNIVKRTVR